MGTPRATGGVMPWTICEFRSPPPQYIHIYIYICMYVCTYIYIYSDRGVGCLRPRVGLGVEVRDRADAIRRSRRFMAE